MPAVRPLLAVVPLVFLLGCRESRKEYTSVVQIARLDIVHSDDKGNTVTADVEVEWTDCPGEQREVVRGDGAFAACLQKHKIGEKLAVKVDWQWDDAGLYDWDILEIAGCKRTPEAHDDSSFDM